MNNKETINNFFTKYYNTLIEISSDYVKKYNYHKMENDEIISELYLHIVESEHRKNKISELVMLSAYTDNYKYNYDNRALYYIAKIIYNVVSHNRNVDGNVANKNVDIVYVTEYFDSDINHNDENYIKESDYYNTNDILQITDKIIDENNWYKYQIWYDYYMNKNTYKELSEKYKLTITPLFTIVQDFNKEIKKYIENISLN